MKIRFNKKFTEMPLHQLFDVNITETANSIDEFYDFVVARCQKELRITEKNYFKVKSIVLGLNRITDETITESISNNCKGAWMDSKERQYIQFYKTLNQKP